MKNPIRKALKKLVERVIPQTSRVAAYNERWAVDSVLGSVDADTMLGILAEAEDGYVERLFMLYRDLMVDSHLQGEFAKRKLAVLKDAPTFAATDEMDPAAVAAKDFIEREWEGLKGKREALTHLLDSTLYPVALVEKIYEPARDGQRRYRLARLIPVPHHLLDYREGYLRVRDVASDGRPLETWHVPTANRYLIHRGHLLTSHPDKWGGPMRAVLFWWLFKTQNREWWARFLDRFGAPFTVGKYESGDERSRSELAYAFAKATKIFGLVIPTGTSVELVQSATQQAGDAFKNFHDVANAELSKLIVGQTMTTEATAGGIGGSQAQVHQAVRDDVRQFDAMALGETLRDDLFGQMLTINGIEAPSPYVTFGGSGEADATAMATLLGAFAAAGWVPGDDAAGHLSRVAGFPVRPRSTALLSAETANVALAQTASAAVSRAFRERFASVARAAGDSERPGDFERAVTQLLTAGDGPAVPVIADALAAFGANGALVRGNDA